MPYLFVILLCIACIITNKYMAPNLRKFSMGLICFFIIIILGLRFRVGMDTINYMNGYGMIPTWEQFKQMDFSESRFEPGYLFTCMVCKSLTSEFWLLQIVMASITNIGIFIFLYKYSRNPFIAVFIYLIIACLYFTVEIIREGASISLFLLNYPNLEKKRWWRYYLFSFFSISFHVSAIITWLFPMVPLMKKVNWVYILAAIGLLAITPLTESLNEVLTIASVANRVNETLKTAEIYNINWRIAEIIKSGTIPIFAIWLAHRSKLQLSLKPFILLKILLCFGTFSIPILFSRFSNYTTIFVCAYAANILTSSKVSENWKYILFGVILLSQANYYKVMKRAFFPYESVLTKEIDPDREQMWLESF